MSLRSNCWRAILLKPLLPRNCRRLTISRERGHKQRNIEKENKVKLMNYWSAIDGINIVERQHFLGKQSNRKAFETIKRKIPYTRLCWKTFVVVERHEDILQSKVKTNKWPLCCYLLNIQIYPEWQCKVPYNIDQDAITKRAGDERNKKRRKKSTGKLPYSIYLQRPGQNIINIALIHDTFL